ncbi:hypothetical protein HYDPIDRAFT_24686 [Hydnomerulius pinastri MD-312]|nr:hypothetical protein HYDPIDRAFT_24686 [Hydnomerulius pinastri MD-312]
MYFCNVLALDVLCALATHWWFKNHEPVISPSLCAFVATIPAPSAYLLSTQSHSHLQCISIAYVVFFTTLFTSIIAYRLSSFHALAGYPGPLLCRISQFATIWNAVDGKLHHYHRKLHQQYGPIVRIGPNELSVADKKLLPSILGTAGMPKGPIFEGRRMTPSKDKDIESFSLITSRNIQRHGILRKAWNKAFGSSELKDYEELLLKRAQLLIKKLEGICGENLDGVGHVDIASLMSFFSFDFMGDIAFGGGFELVRDGDEDNFCHNMNKALFYSAMCQHIPWFSRVLRRIPFIAAPMRTFGLFAFRQSKLRYGQEVKRKDLFYHLVEPYEGGEKAPFPLILSNSVLAIVAGADTTSSALSNIMYYLLANPAVYKRLRDEVDEAFPPSQPCTLNPDMLPSLPFLNAVINETLRLQPPVAASLQRAPEAGSGGKMVGTHYIPEGTAIQVSPFVLHRDPHYFSPSPDSFIPDRWLPQKESPPSSPDFILDRAAFIPFSMGPANCAGKPLAMLELRVVVALFVMHLEMEFGEGYDPASWERELKQYIAMKVGQLWTKMRVRERVGGLE